MADNGKLYIIITDQPVVNSTQTTITQTSQTTTTQTKAPASGGGKQDSAVGMFALHQFYHFVQSTATEITNWSISNIGNFTGDYVKQENVQKTISFGSKLLGIGTSIVAGAKVAGPWGALIAGTIAVAGTGISVALEDRSNAFQIKKQNREIANLRELSGLNELTNGGRI